MHGVQFQNGIPGFSLHFPKELSYGYLRFEGNGKIPWGRQRKKFAQLAVSVQFCYTETPNRVDLFPHLPKGIFPFPSNLRYPQLGSNEKCKKKPGIMKSGSLFLQVDMLKLKSKKEKLEYLKKSNGTSKCLTSCASLSF